MKIIDMGTNPAQAHILLVLAIDPLVTTVDQAVVDVYVNDILAKPNLVVRNKLPEVRPWEFVIPATGSPERIDIFVAMDSENVKYAPYENFTAIEVSTINQPEFPLTTKVVPVDDTTPVVVQFFGMTYRIRGHFVAPNGVEQSHNENADVDRNLIPLPATATHTSPWSFAWTWDDYVKSLPNK